MISFRQSIRPERSYTNHSDAWFPVGRPVKHKIASIPSNLLFLMVKGYNPKVLVDWGLQGSVFFNLDTERRTVPWHQPHRETFLQFLFKLVKQAVTGKHWLQFMRQTWRGRRVNHTRKIFIDLFFLMPKKTKLRNNSDFEFLPQNYSLTYFTLKTLILVLY